MGLLNKDSKGAYMSILRNSQDLISHLPEIQSLVDTFIVVKSNKPAIFKRARRLLEDETANYILIKF